MVYGLLCSASHSHSFVPEEEKKWKFMAVNAYTRLMKAKYPSLNNDDITAMWKAHLADGSMAKGQDKDGAVTVGVLVTRIVYSGPPCHHWSELGSVRS